MSKSQTYIVPGRPARQKEYEDKPLGYEQKTVSDSAVGFDSIPSNAMKAVISVEDATIRYRDDGTDPTTTTGIIAYNGTVIILQGRESITKFKAIRTGAIDAELNCLYYEVI